MFELMKFSLPIPHRSRLQGGT